MAGSRLLTLEQIRKALRSDSVGCGATLGDAERLYRLLSEGQAAMYRGLRFKPTKGNTRFFMFRPLRR